jgi:hypothetical protein
MGIFTTHFLRTATFIFLLLCQIGCVSIGHQYIYTNADGDVIELKKNYQLLGEQYQVIAELTGPLKLADDGITIIELAKGSVIEINNLSSQTEFKIAEQAGKVIYSYQNNDLTQPLTPSVKQTYMSGFFSHTPIAAKQKTDILFTQFGLKSAIQQLEGAANDDTKSAYIDAISDKDLTKSLQQSVVEVIATVSSDYTQRLSAESFVQKQQPLSEKVWLALIAALDDMGSDYELRAFMVAIAPELPNSVNIKNALLASSETIGSDYEKYRLVSELAQQNNAFELSELLIASSYLGSDYEAYRVVTDCAPLMKTQADFDAILTFMQTIGSDYEMRKAIVSLPYQMIDKPQTVQVLNLAADYIGSDYELAQTLTYILRQTPYKAELSSEIDYALASISSDSEKVRVYKLL